MNIEDMERRWREAKLGHDGSVRVECEGDPRAEVLALLGSVWRETFGVEGPPGAFGLPGGGPITESVVTGVDRAAGTITVGSMSGLSEGPHLCDWSHGGPCVCGEPRPPEGIAQSMPQGLAGPPEPALSRRSRPRRGAK